SSSTCDRSSVKLASGSGTWPVAFLAALTSYTSVGAAWDVRRAETRMQPYGIRRASPVRARAAGE
ncbi:hypothetical protein, partial [Amycolatopsis sp. NPDC000740]|uniref:hypothetical protein n=1 Tax=Amycolatopsis sp. NPDC000740 TaxID=3154269 RepID=UPI00331AF0BB